MKRQAAIGVLLTVEVFVGLQARIVGVAELPSLFIGERIAWLQTLAAQGFSMYSHGKRIQPER
jgi:hypothetical protein